MFQSPAQMPPQTRPSGTAWPVDDAWRHKVKAEMKRAGIGMAEMARRIGCDPSALTVAFRSGTKTSRLREAIHRELGWLPPSMETSNDEILRRINHRWPSLTEEQRALVDKLVEQLLAGARR